MIKLPKKTINIVLILATLTAAVYYFSKHKNLLSTLRHVSPILIAEIFLLNIVMFAALILIFKATLNLTKLKIGLFENGLLNAYSMFINFFIPGQAGPAFRGYYLYKKYKLKILDYTLATVIYYVFYGLISVVLVFAGSKPWWMTVSVAAIIIGIIALGSRIYLKRYKEEKLNLRMKPLLYLFLATLLQSVVQIVIYFSELHYLNHNINFNQVVTYTGAANLALFVGLTPGAIGVRETFLILTEKLNHITSSTIVLANVIDRSVFVIFLLCLGVLILAFKAKDRLSVDNIKQAGAESGIK
ncbi:MAG TPA: lysylphosphatidylglycerol synthase domain-containing protein [Candidatus Saccharimonadales bacterium]